MSLNDRLEALQPEPAKILTLDIETSPAVVYAWGLYDQRISTKQVLSPSEVLCFAAKWKNHSRTMFHSEWDNGFDEMIEAAWNLLDEADVVVTYNGPSFDNKVLQRAFLMAGYSPPRPWVNVDLLKVMRKNFKFLSNKLGYVVHELGLDDKLDTGGMELWTRVMAGEPTAQKEMATYNRQDVVITEQLFEFLGPWIDGPHAGLFTASINNCWSCGSERLSPSGISRTKANAHLMLTCAECGAHSKKMTDGSTRKA
jgi:DNA polymerase elongation subunit (family B)